MQSPQSPLVRSTQIKGVTFGSPVHGLQGKIIGNVTTVTKEFHPIKNYAYKAVVSVLLILPHGCCIMVYFYDRWAKICSKLKENDELIINGPKELLHPLHTDIDAANQYNLVPSDLCVGISDKQSSVSVSEMLFQS